MISLETSKFPLKELDTSGTLLEGACETAMKGTSSSDSSAWTRPNDRKTVYAERKERNSRLLLEDIARRSTVFRGLPEIVMLNHTDICNLRCIMCARYLFHGKARLERSVLDRVTDSLFPTARKAGLAAAQAEPLAVDFEYLVEKALKYGVFLDVVTNGTLLTADRYREAREAIDVLEVSVDCHVPSIYERIRLGGRFEDVHANLCAIREERLREPDDVLLVISAVVMKSNLVHLPGLVRLAHDLDAAAVILKRLNHDGKWTPEEEPLEHHGLERMREVLHECSSVARELEISLIRAECGQRGFQLPMDDFIVPAARLPRGRQVTGMGLCWYLAQNYHVMHTGEVFPCIFPTPYSVGNVIHEDPIEIWNGPGFRRLRDAHFSLRGTAVCSKCVLAPHLRGPKPPIPHQE